MFDKTISAPTAAQRIRRRMQRNRTRHDFPQSPGLAIMVKRIKTKEIDGEYQN